MTQIKNKKERTILVGVGKEYGKSEDIHLADPLEELKLLAETAGADIVGAVTQPRSSIDKTYYIGKGKVLELGEEVVSRNASSVIFDNDLSAAQVSNLQKILNIKVIDRSGLILDIFALRARTREAKTQVELAQLKYLLPRLTRQWTHLSRQEGGIGTRGPGETQLEVDRRRVRDRISHLSRTLKTIEKRRHVSRKMRKNIYKIAIVGYTNAGKSTLLNALSGAGVPVEDKLFKTLDSVTRTIRFKSTPDILLTDTVGFIKNLPHDLIASFRSTLEEVCDADLLLHVVDITNPEWEHQIDVVENILTELEVSEKDTVMILNKADLLKNSVMERSLQSRFPSAVLISAQNGTGLQNLQEGIKASLMKEYLTITKDFGPEDNSLLREIYRYGTIVETEGSGEKVRLKFIIPIPLAKKLRIL